MRIHWQRNNFIRLFNQGISDSKITIHDKEGSFLVGNTSALPSPEIVLRIHNSEFYSHVLSYSNLGLAEAYMRRYFTVEEGTLEMLLTILLRNKLDEKVRPDLSFVAQVLMQRVKCFLRSQGRNVQHHYDIGHDLFESFLDQSLTYSCGYVDQPGDTSEKLQLNKFERICAKLELKEGQTLLDIGCGYGGLLIHAARNYQVTGVGITNSRLHWEGATTLIEKSGLSSRIRVDLQDFKDVSGKVDRIVSVGMLEHVPRNQYESFFGRIKDNLLPEGKGLLHFVGANAAMNRHDAFIQKYIFPNSNQPRLSEVTRFLEKYGMPIQDAENMIRHYGFTAQNWISRFRENIDRLKATYDGEFLRMWEYYLCCCQAAAFHSDSALFQVLFTNDRSAVIPLRRI